MTNLPRLVLLPGLDGTGLLFDPLLRSLPAEVKTTVISYPVNQPLGYEELAQIVRERLPQNEPFVLVGESFGGPLSIRIAAEAPAGLCGLALVVTFARKPIRWLPEQIGPFIPPPAFRLLPAWSQLRMLVTGRSSPELKQLFQTALRQVAPRVFAHRVAELLRIDVSEELKRIAVPILVLSAGRDRIVRPYNDRYLRQLRSDAQSEMIDCGHLLLQTAPEQAAELLVRFLTRVGLS